ncbi:hypothetical protein niasHS_007649 [Heterodera schachtii]|uniref:Uncharacterized protein n=1 Tax=Heterodera schachtii TaxID=97005 RepID=A0ABD2JPF1_HETSC
MSPFYWLLFLFFYTLAVCCSISNSVKTFNGQIVADPSTPFRVTVNCEKCEEKDKQIDVVGKKDFQIEMKAKEEKERIGRIKVQIKSLTDLGKQKRSNKWVIEEPSSDKIYKFFIGYFTPNADPKVRLFLHGKFHGQLPPLSEPNTFYRIVLKKPGTENNEIFSQINSFGQHKDSLMQWTEGKGFILKLSEVGIRYVREKERPEMELQLQVVEIEMNSPVKKSYIKPQHSPFSYYQSDKTKGESAASNEFPKFGNLEDETIEKGEGEEGRQFGANWLKKTKQQNVVRMATAGRGGALNGGTIPKVLNGTEKQKEKPRGKDKAWKRGDGTIRNEQGEREAAENASPNASKFPHALARNIGGRVENSFLDESEDDGEHNRKGCCFMPRMSFRRRSSGERAAAVSSPAKSSVADNASSASGYNEDEPLQLKQANGSSESVETNDYGIDDIGTEKTEYGEWPQSPELSPMTGLQSSIRLLRNPSRKEIAETLVRSLSGGASSSAARKRRTKRVVKSDNPSRWSLTRNSSILRADEVKEVVLTVRIGMPVWMNKRIGGGTEETDHFIYSFKLPPPNVIETGEVNKQQVKVEPKPKRSQKSGTLSNRNGTSSSSFLTAASRTSSNSSSLSRNDQDSRIYQMATMTAKKQKIRQNQKNQVNEEQKVSKIARNEEFGMEISPYSPAESKTSTKSNVSGATNYLNDLKMVKADNERHSRQLQMAKNVQKLDSLNGRKSKGIEIKEPKQKVPKVEKNDEEIEAKGKEIVEEKTKPKKKKGDGKSRKSKDTSVDKQKAEGEGMDEIWDKIKSDQKQEEQGEGKGTDKKDGKEEALEEEEEEERSGSAMLRELRQKRGKLKKVSPKKSNKNEQTVTEPVILEEKKEQKTEKKIDKTESQTLKSDEKQTDGQKTAELLDHNEKEHSNAKKLRLHNKSEEIGKKATTANAVQNSDESFAEIMPRNELKKATKSDQSDEEKDEEFNASQYKDMDQDLVRELKETMSMEQFMEFLKETNEQKAKQKMQQHKLDLNLTDAELQNVKNYLDTYGKIQHVENKIVQIGTILNDWLDQKPNIFEGLNAGQIEQLKNILERIYPDEQNVAIIPPEETESEKEQQNNAFPVPIISWEDEESEVEQPLIRRKSQIVEKKGLAEKGDQNAGEKQISGGNLAGQISGQSGSAGEEQISGGNLAGQISGQSESAGEEQISGGILARQMSGHSSQFGQNDDPFSENESVAEVMTHQNIFRMVEDDMEAMRSDAESRAHLGKELQKMCQKGSTGKLDDVFKQFTAADLENLQAILEEVNREKGDTESKTAKKAENLQTEPEQKQFEKGKKAKNLDSEIDIRTDSELHKKQRQKVTRLRPSSAGIGNKSAKEEANAKSTKEEANAKRDKEEANAKRTKEEANAKREKEEANAKSTKEEANAKSTKEEANAKRDKEEANAKREKEEANAKSTKEEANAKRDKEEANAKRTKEEANAKREKEEANAKREKEEANAKSTKEEANANVIGKAQNPNEREKSANSKEEVKEGKCDQMAKETKAKGKLAEANPKMEDEEKKSYPEWKRSKKTNEEEDSVERFFTPKPSPIVSDWTFASEMAKKNNKAGIKEDTAQQQRSIWGDLKKWMKADTEQEPVNEQQSYFDQLRQLIFDTPEFAPHGLETVKDEKQA